MKKSIISATLWSLVAFLVIDGIIARAMVAILVLAHLQAYGTTSALWDQFASTPLAFFATGLVFGTLAAGRNTLKETLTPAAVVGIALAVIVPVMVHQIMTAAHQLERQQNPNSLISPIVEQPLLLTVGASILWACWYVAGAALGHGTRTKRSLPKTA